MWWIRNKETKEPFVFTRRIGFAAGTDYVEPHGARIPRQGETKRRLARVRDMPHGCKQIPTAAEREAGASKPIRICRMCGKCGKYYMPYSDRSQVIIAFKSSGVLTEQGVSIKSLELVNERGKTMDEMVSFPVEKGFALQHRKELWYWSYPKSGRVWYPRAGDVEAAWKRSEKVSARQENRKERRNWRQQRLVMTEGNASGEAVLLPNYF